MATGTMQQPTTGLGSVEETNRLLGGTYFDPKTGSQLKTFTPTSTGPIPMQTATAAPPVTSTAKSTTSTAPSPDDEKLLAMGITPEQLQQLNTPEGLDPVSFQNLIGNVENKLKTNNELVTQRGYLIKQLYDSPLTPDQLKALPEDIQRVVASGDKDTIELQLRLLNDQIAGRGNTLSQSINYLSNAYQTNVAQMEKQRDQAIATVIDFVGQYGSKAPQVIASLYGADYLAKLKGMGIDIAKMASVSTLAQDKEAAAARAAGIGIGGGGSSGGNYSEIINNILASSKFTKEQSAAIVRAINSGEDPLAVIRNNAKNIMTGANATKLESYENTKSATEALDASLKAFYAAGGKTNIFTGNFEKVLNKLGEVNDPRLVGLATEVASNLQVYRNAISGTAYSEQEGQDIASIFPGITKGEILNNAIVSARLKTLSSLIEGIYTNTLGSAYTNLKDAAKSETVTGKDFTDVLPSITLNEAKKEAYIPRNVWSTLGDRMDDLLAEFKADGYTLLVTE